MSVKCGKCKEHHETPTDVRNCYQGVKPWHNDTSGGIKPRQLEFIKTLCTERGIDFERAKFAYEKLSRSQASDEIKKLLAQPKAKSDNGPQPFTSDIPDGRYAVDDDEGVLHFYRVATKNYNGRIFRFIDVQASDDWHPIKAIGTRQAIAEWIKDAGVKEASLRYGHELKHCGICGRSLTKKESRARGIGPDCAEKLGW